MINTIVAIATGGALGALARYGTGLGIAKIAPSSFPYATLCVNVIGSFAMGMLVAFFLSTGQISNEIKMFLTLGFLGSFTTFSTFSYDTMSLWTRGDIMPALGYVAASVILSIGAVFLGAFITWKLIP